MCESATWSYINVIGAQAARPDDGVLDALGELSTLPSVAVGREKHC